MPLRPTVVLFPPKGVHQRPAQDAAEGLADAGDPAAVLAGRQRLWANGYRPVAVYSADASVDNPGKRSVGGDWRQRALRKGV